jgi:hypothetical protein
MEIPVEAARGRRLVARVRLGLSRWGVLREQTLTSSPSAQDSGLVREDPRLVGPDRLLAGEQSVELSLVREQLLLIGENPGLIVYDHLLIREDAQVDHVSCSLKAETGRRRPSCLPAIGRSCPLYAAARGVFMRSLPGYDLAAASRWERCRE